MVTKGGRRCPPRRGLAVGQPSCNPTRYMLLPHYSLGLDIVVAYAKALNSSTLTSSLLWVVRAAMHTLLAHLFHSYAPIPRSKIGQQERAPHAKSPQASARRTSGEASLAIHIRGASCQRPRSGALRSRCASTESITRQGHSSTARRLGATGAASDRTLTPSSSSQTPPGAALRQQRQNEQGALQQADRLRLAAAVRRARP